MGIQKVIIEWSNKCVVCRAVIPYIKQILKKYNINYILRNIGDEYISTFEFHLYQPDVKSISQNYHNIKNPKLKALIDSKNIMKLGQFDSLVKTIYSTPRIYIFLNDGRKIIINGAHLTKEWLQKFEELIQFLNEYETFEVML